MTNYIEREAALNFELEIKADPNEIQAITKGMALYAEYLKSLPVKRLLDVDTFERELEVKYCDCCYDCNKLKCDICWVHDMLEEIEKAVTDDV